MKNILLLILVCSAICCKHKNKGWISGSVPNNSIYNQVEIYCWCFYYAPIKNEDGTISTAASHCTSTIPIKPDELIKPKNLFYSTNDSSTIVALRNVVFNSDKGVKPNKHSMDARLVILFKGDFISDMVVIDDGNQFTFLEKYVFDYSFPVLDSIRSILHVKKIDCKSR